MRFFVENKLSHINETVLSLKTAIKISMMLQIAMMGPHDNSEIWKKLIAR